MTKHRDCNGGSKSDACHQESVLDKGGTALLALVLLLDQFHDSLPPWDQKGVSWVLEKTC